MPLTTLIPYAKNLSFGGKLMNDQPAFVFPLTPCISLHLVHFSAGIFWVFTFLGLLRLNGCEYMKVIYLNCG